MFPPPKSAFKNQPISLLSKIHCQVQKIYFQKLFEFVCFFLHSPPFQCLSILLTMHCLPSTCWPTVLSNSTILPNIITRKESSACEFHLYVSVGYCCCFFKLLTYFTSFGCIHIWQTLATYNTTASCTCTDLACEKEH